MCTFVPLRPLNFGEDNSESLLEGKRLLISKRNKKTKQKKLLSKKDRKNTKKNYTLKPILSISDYFFQSMLTAFKILKLQQ
jgi:hypothetical protein